MTDVTSIFNGFSFHPARHKAWQKTADFCMKIVALFPLTGLAFNCLFPNHEILWVATCIVAPMALGFALQEIYQARRRLDLSEQLEYHQKISSIQMNDPSNPIWNSLLQTLDDNTLSARQWYQIEAMFSDVATNNCFEPVETNTKKNSICHLKL